MKKYLLIFILFFGFVSTASASSIHTFRVEVNGTFSAAWDAEDLVEGRNDVRTGDIVYVKVTNLYGGTEYYFRVDYAAGWHADVIDEAKFEIGRLQERLISDLEASLAAQLFTAAHSGDAGFVIVGTRSSGTRIVKLSFCDCGTTYIQDLPRDAQKVDE